MDYVAHNKAIEYMQKADLLLLFLEKAEGYEGHIPGKLFEYIATGNRILGIGNKDGESAQILSETNTGKIYNPQDTKEIEEEIILQYSNWENHVKPKVNTEKINNFKRKVLTEKLAGLFDDIV